MKIYKLPVVQIPTNQPMIRADRNDQVFKTRRENDERSEVLVFITPKITNRANLRCQ